MKYIPILFSTLMVQALLAGRKTMTRRVNGLDLINKEPDKYHVTNANYIKNGALMQKFFYGNECYVIKCPYGKVGDVLWVRESASLVLFPKADEKGNEIGKNPIWMYRADQHDNIFVDKWKPSIHMPKEACRIFLKITDIKVERLLDISEDDAIAEGVYQYENGAYQFYTEKELHRVTAGINSAFGSFMSLWQSINGASSWDANPWVWVIKFEQIEKPEDFK